MAFRTTNRADEDLIGIYLHGHERFGREQAERYHADLIRRFRFLADHPLSNHERTEFRPPVRLCPHRAHVIVYTMVDDGILIVRVLHGHQDWEQHV